MAERVDPVVLNRAPLPCLFNACVLLFLSGANHSLLFRAPVNCGCPAGTHMCHIVSRVTHDIRAPACALGVSLDCWVLWSGKVESSSVVLSKTDNTKSNESTEFSRRKQHTKQQAHAVLTEHQQIFHQKRSARRTSCLN